MSGRSSVESSTTSGAIVSSLVTGLVRVTLCPFCTTVSLAFVRYGMTNTGPDITCGPPQPAVIELVASSCCD